MQTLKELPTPVRFNRKGDALIRYWIKLYSTFDMLKSPWCMNTAWIRASSISIGISITHIKFVKRGGLTQAYVKDRQRLLRVSIAITALQSPKAPHHCAPQVLGMRQKLLSAICRKIRSQARTSHGPTAKECRIPLVGTPPARLYRRWSTSPPSPTTLTYGLSEATWYLVLL